MESFNDTLWLAELIFFGGTVHELICGDSWKCLRLMEHNVGMRVRLGYICLCLSLPSDSVSFLRAGRNPQHKAWHMISIKRVSLNQADQGLPKRYCSVF